MKHYKSINQIVLFSLCLFLSEISAGYPYQKPDRFNQKYQRSNYFLVGDLYFYTDFLPEVAKNKHFATNSSLINPDSSKSHLAQFTPNKKYNIFSMFYKQGENEDCVAYTLPKPINGNTRILFYSPDMSAYPSIVIYRKEGEDKIIIYIAFPNRKDIKSSKLTFDIDNFEKYMKTTAWYNTRKELNERLAWRDSGVFFGFSMNADLFDFTIPQSINVQNFSISFAEIIGASRWATCYREERYQYIQKIIPFTETIKIAETSTKNSQKDLFEPHTITWQGTEITIPPIVTISPMNLEDFTIVNKLIKEGNTN